MSELAVHVRVTNGHEEFSIAGSNGTLSDTNGSKAQNLSTASTQVVDNTVHNTAAVNALHKHDTAPRSPGTNKSMDRQKREKAAQQLMKRLVDPSKKSPTSLQPDSLRARRNRRRSGGGAYAKLLLSGKSALQKEKEKESKENVSDETPPFGEMINNIDSSQTGVEVVNEEQEQKEIKETSAASIELDEKRKQAVNEFSKGTETNSRYHSSSRLRKLMEEKGSEDSTDDVSFASLPSVLNRSEIFHENATAAVLALLTPRSHKIPSSPASIHGDGISVMTERSVLDEAGLKVSSGKKGLMLSPSINATSRSAFRSPQCANDNMSVVSNISNSMDVSNESILIPQSSGYIPKSSIDEPVLSLDAERALNAVKERMKDPPKTLAELLAKVATPDDASDMDRAFMVRRKNACGALKVLTANPSNRRTLCWTVGVLTALSSVLEDTGVNGLKAVFPDSRTRSEYIEARKRAVSALVNLVIPRENRIPVFHSPGLMQSVSKVMIEDDNESRQGCSALVAYLAKTQENRILTAQVPGLLHAMTTVIAPKTTQGKTSKKMYVFDNDTDDGDSSVNSLSTDGNDFSIQSSVTDRFTVTESCTQSEDENDSDATPQRSTTLTTMQKMVEAYDKDPNQFLHGARSHIFAALLHLVKERDNTYILVRHDFLMETLVNISKLHGSSSHVHALRIIANLTRHPGNSKHIVFKLKIVVPAMVLATRSKNNTARLYALYTIQNLSEDRSCRQEISNTKDLVVSLCQRARQAKLHEEQLAAVSTLKNLTDEPANLIPMSNTPECFATLMQIAHGGDERIQYLACDALSTLSHWLRKIATSGSSEAAAQPSTTNALFVPSLRVVPFNQWS